MVANVTELLSFAGVPIKMNSKKNKGPARSLLNARTMIVSGLYKHSSFCFLVARRKQSEPMARGSFVGKLLANYTPLEKRRAALMRIEMIRLLPCLSVSRYRFRYINVTFACTYIFIYSSGYVGCAKGVRLGNLFSREKFSHHKDPEEFFSMRKNKRFGFKELRRTRLIFRGCFVSIAQSVNWLKTSRSLTYAEEGKETVGKANERNWWEKIQGRHRRVRRVI